METVNTMELGDASVFPDESVLRKVLADAYPAYAELLDLFAANGLRAEWRYYHDGKAWLCKVQKSNRTIVWMSAWKGYMQACIYFPERLLDEVLSLGISKATKDRILETKKVGKSKPCIFEVRSSAVLLDFEIVMKFKMTVK